MTENSEKTASRARAIQSVRIAVDGMEPRLKSFRRRYFTASIMVAAAYLVGVSRGLLPDLDGVSGFGLVVLVFVLAMGQEVYSQLVAMATRIRRVVSLLEELETLSD